MIKKNNSRNTSDILAIHKSGSDFQKIGDIKNAASCFNEIVKNSDINKKIKASAYFHLSQMETDLEKKKEYLSECLLIENEHRRARLYYDSLNKSMMERITNDKSKSLIKYFSKHLLNIQIQTISACNASCVFCPYQTSWQKENPGRMDDKTFNQILEIFKGIPLGKVCLYLENEPLLDKKIFDRILAVKEKLKYNLIEISTNVSLLNIKNIKRLYEVLNNTPHEVWISWHGINKKQYEHIMGLNFEKSKKNLLDYFKYTKGELNTVINTIFGGKLHEDVMYSTKNEAEEFFINLLKDCYDGFDKDFLNINTMLFHNRAGEFDIKSDLSTEVKQKLGRLHPNCPRISEWMHFTYDGDLILCCMDYNKQTIMGNINDFLTFEELLASKSYNNIRLMALGKIKTDAEFLCKKCIGV